MSNSGLVNLSFTQQNKNISGGRAGEVSVKLIEKVLNSNNENVIQVSSLE